MRLYVKQRKQNSAEVEELEECVKQAIEEGVVDTII